MSAKQKDELIYEQDLLLPQQICITRNILNLMKAERAYQGSKSVSWLSDSISLSGLI